MNYYEHHIGDYAAATGHLSLVEDAVYTRMLRRYYLTESPLPADVAQLARLVGARQPEEIAAVEAVLHEFFRLADDGWHQKRADEDIERYRAKIDAARENGRRGGRPPNKPSEKGSVNSGSENKTQLKAHQAPDTRLHTPEEEQGALPAAPPPADPKPKASKGSRLPADWTLPDDWATWAKEARPDLHPAAVAARFADHWHAKPGKDGVKLDWLATWRNWVRGEKTASVGGWQRPAEPRRIDTPEETRKRLAEAAPRKVSDPQTASAAMAASMAMLRGGRDD